MGVIIPVLKDAGETSSAFGQLVVAAGSIADFGAIVLLSLFFSGEGGVGSTLLLIGALLVLAVAVFVGAKGAERSKAVRADLIRLQDTTAQIRVRERSRHTPWQKQTAGVAVSFGGAGYFGRWTCIPRKRLRPTQLCV